MQPLKSLKTKPSTSTTSTKRLRLMACYLFHVFATSISMDYTFSELSYVLGCKVEEVFERCFHSVWGDTWGVSFQNPKAQRSSLGVLWRCLFCFQCCEANARFPLLWQAHGIISYCSFLSSISLFNVNCYLLAFVLFFLK